jgi:hypothetical protein
VLATLNHAVVLSGIRMDIVNVTLLDAWWCQSYTRSVDIDEAWYGNVGDGCVMLSLFCSN